MAAPITPMNPIQRRVAVRKNLLGQTVVPQPGDPNWKPTRESYTGPLPVRMAAQAYDKKRFPVPQLRAR